jgi:hypothetical protein
MREFEPKDFKNAAYNPRKRHEEANKKRVAAGEESVEFVGTEEVLHELWKAQKGQCALCGIEMDLVGESHIKSVTNPLRVTVDRIDPKLLYVKGNVRLLHDVCNSFRKTLNDHTVYGIARGIVKTFEENNKFLRIDINPELVSRDNDKTFSHAMAFHVESNPENIVVPTAARPAVEFFMDELLIRSGQMPKYHTFAEMIEKLKAMYPHVTFPSMGELAQLAAEPPAPPAASQENTNG